MTRMYLMLIAACALLFSITGGAHAETAVIIHPDNPIQVISPRDIKKIFLGKIRKFPETNNELFVFDQQIEGDSRKRFYAKFIGISESKLYRYRASYLFSGKGRIPEVLTDDEAVKNKIASDIAAIGYIDNAQVDETVKVVLVLDI